MRSKRILFLTAGACVLALAGFYVLASAVNGTLSSQWMPWKVHDSKSRGNEIVSALETYMKDNGHYPTSLDDLCPTYIAHIRQPTAGAEQWTYFADNDGKSFTLSFASRSASVPGWYYRPDLKRWVFKSF